MFGPQIDAGIACRAQRIGAVDHGALDHLGSGDRGAGQRVAARRRQRIIVAMVPQPTIEKIDVELERVARVILHGRGNAEPLAVGIPRGWRLRGRLVDARKEVGACRRIDVRTDIGGTIFGEAPAPVAIAELVILDLAIGDRDQRGEIAPAVRDEANHARRDAAGVVIGLALGGNDQLIAGVERLGAGQLHRAGNAAFILLCRIGFLDRHAVEQLRREQAVIERARTGDAAAIVHARSGVAEHFHAI
ncbi:hypothetical protein D9M73_110050 [compost metagenome]